MSKRGSAGPPKPSRKTQAACASPSPKTACSETLEADYVVGCDGSHSTIRKQIGIERSGADFDQIMVLALFRSKELHEKLKRFPPRSTYRVLHPDLKGYWQFFGRVDVGERWFFHSPVPANTTRDNYDFQALLEKSAGFPFAADFDYVGFWDLRIAVAETYQVGRVFIAGDAAHSHPPYGGYGLNNGLDDVANLGWKLAATLQGWGGDTLLASYTEERRPIFKETGENFIEAGIKRDADFLARYNPDKDRDAFERAWKDHAGAAGRPRHHLRAALRRFADRARSGRGEVERASARTPSRPAPAITCRRSCCPPGATSLRSSAAVSRCWLSTPMQSRFRLSKLRRKHCRRR